MEEELDYDIVRHLLGPLADEILGPRMTNLDHDQDPFQELLREASDQRLAERWPLSMHCGGSRINNHGLGSFGSDQFARSVLVERHKHPLIKSAAKYQPGCESSVEGNSVDAYFSKLINISNLKETMTDPMRSKEFQDLVGHSSKRLRDEILVSLCSDIIPLLQVCCNPHGIRSIKKLFENLNASCQRCFAAMTISTIVTSLFKDLCGQAVIEFCLKNFSDMENVDIFLEVSKHLLEIAKDQRGCGMLMKCMAMSEGLFRDLIFCTTVENSTQLSVHPSGNYLVQRLFEFNIPWLTNYTQLHLRGAYHVLSRDKYGSHVIQKCLSQSSRMQFKEIAEELMGGPNFTELFTDPYGNYVIQTMHDRAKDCGVVYDNLRTMIESKREQLESNPHARGVLQLIRKQKNRSRLSRFRGDCPLIEVAISCNVFVCSFSNDKSRYSF